MSHAITSTGSNAQFRQEQSMEQEVQQFVFPSVRQGGGGAGCFPGCSDNRNPALHVPSPTEKVCLLAFFRLTLITSWIIAPFPPPHTCVSTQHTEYFSVKVWAPPCYILWVLQITLPPPSLTVVPLVASLFLFVSKLLGLWTERDIMKKRF